MASEFERYSEVYRVGEEGMAYLPLMFVGILIAMPALVAIYAKGYEGGSGVVEGARFGALIGFFLAVLSASVNYGTLHIGRKLALYYAAAGFFEWVINGMVIGLVYRPAVQCRPASDKAGV
jgi:hypothetical protein